MSTKEIAYQADASVAALNKVEGFNPMRYIRKTEKGAVLDLPYKKLWFRAKHPNGKIRVLIRNLSDQIAAIEARVYFDRGDSEPAANFLISGVRAADQDLVANAQLSAIDHALSDAGFGLQFLPAEPSENKPVPNTAVTRTKRAVKEVKEKKEPAKSPAEPPVMQESAVPNTQATPQPTKTEEVKTDGSESADPLLAFVNTLEQNSMPIAQEEIQPEATPETHSAESESVVKEEQTESSTAPSYTKEMAVEEICSMMTVEEAENYIVEGGVCNGWTMATVYERRPKFIDFYINTYEGDNNILRAAARIVKASKG